VRIFKDISIIPKRKCMEKYKMTGEVGSKTTWGRSTKRSALDRGYLCPSSEERRNGGSQISEKGDGSIF